MSKVHGPRPDVPGGEGQRSERGAHVDLLDQDRAEVAHARPVGEPRRQRHDHEDGEQQRGRGRTEPPTPEATPADDGLPRRDGEDSDAGGSVAIVGHRFQPVPMAYISDPLATATTRSTSSARLVRRVVTGTYVGSPT